MLKTRITELFGIKYPIMAGPMAYLTTPTLVAAVSNAGGLGVLVSTTIPTAQGYRQCNDKLGQGIGLIHDMPDVKEIIDSIISEATEVIRRLGSIGL